MKRRGLNLLFILSILIVLSVNIYALSIQVKPESQCDSPAEGYIIMGLSNMTNAHGELYNQGNYNYVLCADFAGSNTCSGTNAIVSLSGQTNAHAELNAYANYNNDVCYDSVECTVVSGDSTCTLPYIHSVLSLSADTNAHLAEPNHYNSSTNKKICCRVINTPAAYWSNGGSILSSLTLNPSGGTAVNLVLDYPVSTNVDFKIYKEGILGDQHISSFDRDDIVVSNNRAMVTIYLDSQFNDGDVLYFTATDSTDTYSSNPELLIHENPDPEYCETISVCGGYLNSGNCSSDTCSVVSDELASSNPPVTCSDGTTTCFCEWKPSESVKCQASYTSPIGQTDTDSDRLPDPEQSPSCNYFDDPDSDNDGYDDGLEIIDLHTDACNATSNPLNDTIVICPWQNDQDCDQVPDDEDPCPNDADCDNDGWSDYTEIRLGTDPRSDQSTPGTSTVYPQCSIRVTKDDPNGCADGKIEYFYVNSCDGVEKSNSIACPAEIQLPFFGFYNFILTAVVIALIYYFMYHSNSRKRNSRRFIK